LCKCGDDSKASNGIRLINAEDEKNITEVLQKINNTEEGSKSELD